MLRQTSRINTTDYALRSPKFLEIMMRDIRRRIEFVEERDVNKADTIEQYEKQYREIFDEVCRQLRLSLQATYPGEFVRYYGYIPEMGLAQSVRSLQKNLLLLMPPINAYFEKRIRDAFDPDFSLYKLEVPTATRESVKQLVSEKGSALAEHFGIFKYALETHADNPNKTIWEELEVHEMLALNAASVVHVGTLRYPSKYCSFWEIGR